MGRLIALVLALIVGAAFAWREEKPPAPRPATATATAFSAERAMVDDRAIGSIPHPIGSVANHQVRDYLLKRMTELGLAPQVHRGVAAYAPRRAPGVLLGGDVEDLVGVLPGRDRNAPALALMAHYDSVPSSPGAADDAAGVVSALEIVRALEAKGEPPARDVMIILTDGEEAGLLGADAFFNRDPLARHVGFLINMEARGDAGRVQMFQTGAHNGQAIGLLRRNAIRPSSSSLTVFIYEHMPNDTDFTISKAAGVAGLNFAFAGRQFDYHSPTSTPATMDPGTLQDMGQQVLAVAQAAAFAPTLPGRAPDVVYSHVAGDFVLAYPPAVGWLVLALSAVMIALAAIRARRVEPFPWTDPLRGAGAALFAILGAVAIMHLARRATGAAFGYLEQRFLLAQVTHWEIALILLGLGFLLMAAAELGRGRRQIAFVPLAAGLAASLFGFDPVGLGLGVVSALIGVAAYGRPVSRSGAWTGVLLLGLLLALVVQALAPLAAFVLAWPLLFAALAAVLTDAAARRGPVALAVLAVVAALGVAWVGEIAHGAFISLDLVEVLGAPLLLAAYLVWPLAQPAEGAPPERLLGPLLLVAGLVVTAAVRFNDPYSARYPRASYVVYQLDQDTRRAWIVSATPELSPWARSVLTSGGGRIGKLANWVWARPVDAAPAPYVPEPAPTISLDKLGNGDLQLHIAPPTGAQDLALSLTPDTPATVLAVDGAPLTAHMAPGKAYRVRWMAAPEGLTLTLRPAGPGKLTVRYDAKAYRWPAGVRPLPPRPPTVMPFNDSDSTFITGSRRFAW